MPPFESFGQRARDLKCDVLALYLARNDPRIQWHVKAVIDVPVTYALSPIDFIPDIIPVLGYLEDLIIIPAGIAFAVSGIPPGVLEEYRERARTKIPDYNKVPLGWIHPHPPHRANPALCSSENCVSVHGTGSQHEPLRRWDWQYS